MTDRRAQRLAGVAGLVMAALFAFPACSESSGSDADNRAAGSSPSSTAADCRLTRGGPAQGAPGGSELSSVAKLEPGSSVTPEEAAAEAPARRGTPLVLTGTVYGADCRTPLAGAVLEVWQTDARGEYGPGHGGDNLRCCYLQATVETDSKGRYTLQTIRPGHYRGEDPPPPGHIHFNVYHRDSPGVFTEVVFADDPYLDAAESEAEVVTLRRESGPRLVGEFDIVLAGKS
jgi:catechol 1,2-dioxygenase